jgi:phosphatidylinositol kinase/protein kinase (PI-3  family)
MYVIIGIKRERSPFVFTPLMAYVMGGRTYKTSPLFASFQLYCTQAFNSLRKHAALFENLFTLVSHFTIPIHLSSVVTR